MRRALVIFHLIHYEIKNVPKHPQSPINLIKNWNIYHHPSLWQKSFLITADGDKNNYEAAWNQRVKSFHFDLLQFEGFHGNFITKLHVFPTWLRNRHNPFRKRRRHLSLSFISTRELHLAAINLIKLSQDENLDTSCNTLKFANCSHV